MSPLNRGPLMGPRALPPIPMQRFGRVPPSPMGRVMPPLPPPMYGPPHRGRPPLPPPPQMMAPPPMMFGPRGRRIPPIPPMPLRRPMNMHGPMMMRPGPRGVLPPHALPHMRPRLPSNNKTKNSSPKKNKVIEDLQMKKPWMTNEIRSVIQKKNKLYAKAKKNKDAKEWEEFKDLRNKVTRMIRDAKSEYFTKHPDQVAQKTAEKKTVVNESVEKTELNGESKPSSEQAQS